MAIADPARTAAAEQIDTFCESRIPVELHDKIRLEQTVRGTAITIVERRPPWRPDLGPEWTSSDIARLSFEPVSAAWSLEWKGSDGRWHPYTRVGPSHGVAPLLAEIDADPTGIFWG